MTRVTLLATIGALALAGAAWAAVTPPAALAGATPGLWEIAGLPGAKAPAKECVAELATLVQYEHRKANCSSHVLSDKGNSVVVSYECRGGGFGRSAITAITPRSLRIETQGISDGMPFNYVLQARRVGECPGGAAPQAH